jgi:alkylation response protein AidB-like acyl-CoA dehydrogenase
MDFAFTKEEEAFRREVRDFLQKELPAHRITYIVNPAEDPVRDDVRELNRIMARKLGEKGWLTLSWPVEYGGRGGNSLYPAIFYEEMRYCGAPGFNAPGSAMVGPTLINFGSEQQKKQHLPPIARGEILWCQGFSEPEAGCDLASLQTSARKDNDGYIINGRKVWTSGAFECEWGFFLARTDPDTTKKHRGISFFLVDMNSPGITVRPIKDMGGGSGLCEVFLDEVRVQQENIVGKENQGWEIAMSLLDLERGLDLGAIGFMRRVFELLVEHIREQGLETNPIIRQRMADIAIEIETARLLSYRALLLANKELPSTSEISMSKMYINESQQRVANTMMKILGPYGQLKEDSKYTILQGIVERWYLETFSFTLFGGTSEVQKNLIAIRGLGLPRS